MVFGGRYRRVARGFRDVGPDHLHNTQCAISGGRVRYVERGPTFANPRQTWGTPQIENGAHRELYTSDEMWATRQVPLRGAGMSTIGAIAVVVWAVGYLVANSLIAKMKHTMSSSNYEMTDAFKRQFIRFSSALAALLL